MLGDLIAGSPREMNYSVICFKQYLKSYHAMSRFLVNNFCAYCSNLEWNPFLCTFQYCHSFMYLNKWKVTGIVTGRIMARNDLPGINSRWVKCCHDIPITSWGAVVTIEDNYVFCKMKKLSLLNWYWINYVCSYRKESSFDFRCFFLWRNCIAFRFQTEIHIISQMQWLFIKA